ncbi:cytochrome c [Roseibium porphyridii]|uniref:Cytochrome c n=1 Tax=Roseibium porphyridii TaxID=2866279 RepID=A0ABY8F2B3_9HYPH|nr:cytochrome c [Roseibium sp. KMA01]WFE89521.1 cytochrome c [Roseibium sp. KMA01]
MLRLVAIGLFFCSAAIADEHSSPDALIRLVHQDCGSCHGLTLKGGLGPDIRPDALSHYDVETLSEVVLDGIQGTAMPPWRPLMSETEAKKIAEYLLQGELK